MKSNRANKKIMAGYIAIFIDTEGNRVGLRSMA